MYDRIVKEVLSHSYAEIAACYQTVKACQALRSTLLVIYPDDSRTELTCMALARLANEQYSLLKSLSLAFMDAVNKEVENADVPF